MSQPIPQLRPYQHQALEEIRSAFFERGLNRLLVVHPTGAGKTFLFSHLLQHNSFAEWLAEFPSQERRVLVIAHRAELLDQAAASIAKHNPKLRVAVEQGERIASDDDDVVIASIASIGTRLGRLERLNPDSFRIVIIDEAHHAVATTYRRVIDRLGLSATGNRDRLLVGFTATPDRADGVGLYKVFDEIAHSCSLLELIDKGVLADLAAFQVKTTINLDSVTTRSGDFAPNELAAAIDRKKRNMAIVAAYARLAPDRQAVVFAASVTHAESLSREFCTHLIPAAAVHGQLPSEKRQRLLQEFRDGALKVLVNCMLLTEGFDHPPVSCIIQARPTKSRALYMQMIGRGTRRTANKADCIIIDVVDNWCRHSVVTVASLLGLAAPIDLRGESVAQVARALDHDVLAQYDIEGLSLGDVMTLATAVPLSGQDGRVAWAQSTRNEFVTVLDEPLPRRLVVYKEETVWRVRTILPIRRSKDRTCFKVLAYIPLVTGWVEFDRHVEEIRASSAEACREAVEDLIAKRARLRAKWLSNIQSTAQAAGFAARSGEIEHFKEVDAEQVQNYSTYEAFLLGRLQRGATKLMLASSEGFTLWSVGSGGRGRQIGLVTCEDGTEVVIYAATNCSLAERAHLEKLGEQVGAILPSQASNFPFTLEPVRQLVRRRLEANGWHCVSRQRHRFAGALRPPPFRRPPPFVDPMT